MMTLKKYTKLYHYLRENNYSFSEAIHVMKRVDKLDNQIKEYFELWLMDGIIPEKDVKGVTFKYLTSKEAMNPIRAFLMLDWIKREPEEALYYLGHEMNYMPIILTEENLRQLDEAADRLKEKGIDVKLEDETLPDENATDDETVDQVIVNNNLSVTD